MEILNSSSLAKSLYFWIELKEELRMKCTTFSAAPVEKLRSLEGKAQQMGIKLQ